MKNFNYTLMVLLGGVMYGTMSSFVKLSYSWGYTAAELSFSQAFLAALFLGGILLVSSSKTESRKLSLNDLISLLFIGSTIGLTNFLYYQSVSYISASLAIVILMNFTWFSLLLEWVIFHKKPSRFDGLTILFILIGSVLAANLIQVEALSFSWQGITLALTSSLTYAVYIIANSRVGKSVKWQSKSTLIMAGSACTIFLINARAILSDTHFDYAFLLWAVFLAVVGTTIPTALFAVGIPRIGAGVSSILMTIEFPVAVLCAHIILDEPINPIQIIGIAIMLTAIAAMKYGKPVKIRKGE